MHAGELLKKSLEAEFVTERYKQGTVRITVNEILMCTQCVHLLI